MGFFSWLKGVFSKMISKSEVEQALQIHTALSSEMSSAIGLWASMYRNTPPWKSKTVQTANLPAVIAWKVAKLVTLEAEMKLTGGPRADWLAECVNPVWGNLRAITEQAAAKGGMVFKPYLAKNQVFIDRVQADRFFPTAFDSNGELTGGVFAAQKSIGRTIYTRLEQHEYKNGTHHITQRAFRSSGSSFLGSSCSLTDVPDWADIPPENYIYNLERPLFVYWKMPFANSIDDTSPLGVSVYAKAAETIEQFDRQYGRFIWEFESGERAVHASQDLFRSGKDGKLDLPEGKERLYRMVDNEIEDGKNLFQEFSPTLRDASMVSGMNTLLRQIEWQCGLSAGTFSDPQTVAKTATEILSSRQETYTTIADIQKSLEAALRQLFISVCALGDAAKIAPKGSYDAAFKWDDSIITDKEERRKELYQLAVAGKFPMWRYYVECLGFPEKEAREIAAELTQGTGDPYAEPRIP